MAIVHVFRLSIFLSTILIRFPTILSTISDSHALLKLKASFTNTTVLDSWKVGSEPCAKGRIWEGVVCGNSGSPSGLHLRGFGLSGRIDIDALVLLPGLRSISFVGNEFSGPLPSFNRLVALKGLFLSKNQFSGEIPSDYFEGMRGLKKVWLSKNKFSGQIPLSLGNLSRLMELHLEYNHFSGTIPTMLHPGLISLNFSNNNLEGEIPSTMLRFGLSSFQGNSGLCGITLGNSCNTTKFDSNSNTNSKLEKPHSRRKFFISVLLATAVMFVVMLVAILVLTRKRRSSGLTSSQQTMGRTQRKTRSTRKTSKRICKGVGDIVTINAGGGGLAMNDLMKAAAELIGYGTLGCAYKATMTSGVTVVVKRIKEMDKIGKDQFDAEMRRLGSLTHKNVASPLAYHYRREEKLLVYGYQPRGSLLYALHGDPSKNDHRSDMTWPVRLHIIQGIARGLAFLHAELPMHELPHGNLKSTNVLLTSANEPVLIDYGFTPLLSSRRAAQAQAAYKTPEGNQISPKSDVYCLGVIIFEIITGRAPKDEGAKDMVKWVRSAIEEQKQVTVFDASIAAEAVTKSSNREEMEKALQVGIA